MASHVSQNTDASHLASFYTTFDQIKDKRYDGMIITGAPGRKSGFRGCGLLAGAVRHYGVDQDSCPFHSPCVLGGPSRPLLPLRHSQILSAQKTVRCLPTYYYKKTIPPGSGDLMISSMSPIPGIRKTIWMISWPARN